MGELDAPLRCRLHRRKRSSHHGCSACGQRFVVYDRPQSEPPGKFKANRNTGINNQQENIQWQHEYKIGNTVWWLGMSVDGRTFTNVFHGMFQNGQISGDWADVPLGATSNAGTLVLTNAGGEQTTVWTRSDVSGGFGRDSWEKLYDVGVNRLVVIFENVTASGAFWPDIPEPFELTVAGQRVEVRAIDPQPGKGDDGRKNMHANLNARIPVADPETGPLRMSAAFAGYRAKWTISYHGLKPGEYVQILLTPRELPAVPRLTREKEAATESKSPAMPFDRDSCGR